MAKSKTNSKKKTASTANRSALQRSVSQQSAGRTQAKQSGTKKERGFLAYFRGVRQEFKKVVWPTRSELYSDTVVVIAVCAFFALAFWLIDTGFLAILKGVLGVTLS